MYRYITFKNQELAYRLSGNGSKTLVLLHGFPESSDIFRNQLPALEAHFTVIIPDLPGAGKSPYNDALTTMEDFAEAVYEILQNENMKACTMIGHSMGGYITLAFAEKHSTQLNGFGLLHSHASADSEEGIANRQKNIKSMQAYGAMPLLQTMLPGLFGEKFKQEHPGVIESLLREAGKMDVQALIRFQEIMIGRKDRTDVLKNSQVPVLFILGTDDQSARLENVLPQTKIPRRSEVVILQDTGHMGMFEAVDEVNETILNFVSNV
ncbi:alpha/beta fold hydrolase [Haoranjiania flava]|uniref:Alpha/beta hydrolase n=1 Tax=Haoranjiania flava TaxID=1856322 RepID=A0AAE3IK20_9BACT|nr:alpha/beta hydrolase [Haoranjiania flava]MCU7693154.1 alpha/beta hydrolase [Haoranjiania flava]